MEDLQGWRMGLVLPTDDGVFFTWLRRLTQSLTGERFPVPFGWLAFFELELAPLVRQAPLSGWVVGGAWDSHSTCPVFRCVAITATPIGDGARLMVEVACRHADAQAYIVRLVQAMIHCWPAAGPTVWAQQPSHREHPLGQLKLKTDRNQFALGLDEFAAAYHTPAVLGVSFVRKATPHAQAAKGPAGNRHQAWEVRLHLPVAPQPCQHIDAVVLQLTVSRMSGKYPIQFSLTLRGYAFPEAQAFAADFLAWCQANWRTAPVGPGLYGAQQPRTRPGAPAGHPWELIPDHLWDRAALRLWWQGLTSVEIGGRISQAPKTVRNRLTQLRKQHGAEVVPYNRRRDQAGTAGG